jgi:hypothetical protein
MKGSTMLLQILSGMLSNYFNIVGDDSRSGGNSGNWRDSTGSRSCSLHLCTESHKRLASYLQGMLPYLFWIRTV